MDSEVRVAAGLFGRPRSRQLGWLLAVCTSLAPLSGAAAPKFTTLYTFSDGAKGFAPVGELVMDKDGVLYGTTEGGGPACPSGRYTCGGVVYRLTPPTKAGRPWTQKVLYGFKGGKDGATPRAGVRRLSNGALFGTTRYGGDTACTWETHGWGCGTIFQLIPPTATRPTWTKRIVHEFTGEPDGRFPESRLVRSRDGNLYGATAQGGKYGHGMAFRLTREARAASGIEPSIFVFRDRDSVILDWAGSTGGGEPLSTYYACDEDEADDDDFNCIDSEKTKSAAVASPPSPLFGATSAGGTDRCGAYTNGDLFFNGCGVLYELIPPASADKPWREKVLHSLIGYYGAVPNEGGVVGPDGSLYGHTLFGGLKCNSDEERGCGVVFRLKPPTPEVPRWTYTVLWRFKGGRDGVRPVGRLQLGKDGSVYGATVNGGGCSYSTAGCGTVYKLTPPAVEGGRPWTRTVLHRFQNGTDGKWPTSGVLRGPGGALYGSTDKTVYKITP